MLSAKPEILDQWVAPKPSDRQNKAYELWSRGKTVLCNGKPGRSRSVGHFKNLTSVYSGKRIFKMFTNALVADSDEDLNSPSLLGFRFQSKKRAKELKVIIGDL